MCISSSIRVIDASACCHWSNTCDSCWIGAKNWSRYRRNVMTVADVIDAGVHERSPVAEHDRVGAGGEEQDEREVEGLQALGRDPRRRGTRRWCCGRSRCCGPRARTPARRARPRGSPGTPRSRWRSRRGPLYRRARERRRNHSVAMMSGGMMPTISASVTCHDRNARTISTPKKLSRLTSAWMSPVCRSCEKASTSVVMRVMMRPAISRS